MEQLHFQTHIAIGTFWGSKSILIGGTYPLLYIWIFTTPGKLLFFFEKSLKILIFSSIVGGSQRNVPSLQIFWDNYTSHIHQSSLQLFGGGGFSLSSLEPKDTIFETSHQRRSSLIVPDDVMTTLLTRKLITMLCEVKIFEEKEQNRSIHKCT